MEGNGLLEAHGTEQLTIRGLQDDASIPSSELPFLVTHWLANYQSKVPEEFIDRQEQDAIQQIHNAAAELASAFTSLGAYGTANVVSCSSLACICTACNSSDTMNHSVAQPETSIR